MSLYLFGLSTKFYLEVSDKVCEPKLFNCGFHFPAKRWDWRRTLKLPPASRSRTRTWSTEMTRPDSTPRTKMAATTNKVRFFSVVSGISPMFCKLWRNSLASNKTFLETVRNGRVVWVSLELTVAKETQEHKWKMHSPQGVVEEWDRTKNEHFWKQLSSLRVVRGNSTMSVSHNNLVRTKHYLDMSHNKSFAPVWWTNTTWAQEVTIISLHKTVTFNLAMNKHGREL